MDKTTRDPTQREKDLAELYAVRAAMALIAGNVEIIKEYDENTAELENAKELRQNAEINYQQKANSYPKELREKEYKDAESHVASRWANRDKDKNIYNIVTVVFGILLFILPWSIILGYALNIDLGAATFLGYGIAALLTFGTRKLTVLIRSLTTRDRRTAEEIKALKDTLDKRYATVDKSLEEIREECAVYAAKEREYTEKLAECNISEVANYQEKLVSFVLKKCTHYLTYDMVTIVIHLLETKRAETCFDARRFYEQLYLHQQEKAVTDAKANRPSYIKAAVKNMRELIERECSQFEVEWSTIESALLLSAEDTERALLTLMNNHKYYLDY